MEPLPSVRMELIAVGGAFFLFDEAFKTFLSGLDL